MDSDVDLEDAVHYPVEFLHTLNPPMISPRNLQLKVSAPIVLLRNLILLKLCNGTPLQVKASQRNFIEAYHHRLWCRRNSFSDVNPFDPSV